MATLEDQHALVTGGGSGLGLAIAQRLAADGAIVTICGRDDAKLKQALESLPEGTRSITCDVRDEDSVRAAVEHAAAGGGLHLAIANAGTGTVGPITTTDLAAWNAVLETNLTGVFLTFKHAGAAIARSGGGAMVAISSIAGVLTHRYMGPYCVSKAAVEMLVRNTADELGLVGVRVNAVRPGLVPTELSSGLVSSAHIQADYLDQMPLGRLGKPEDVAEAVRYLAGPESAWTTGQIFAVDGGHTLRRGPDMHGLMEQSIGADAVRAMLEGG
ncbi:MAG TPA: glucose 1-dehydrogenase [Acidimicrobiales bacterium]|nr:glucose 1-dehydrogenase [Acidimicrobiales bacterium]